MADNQKENEHSETAAAAAGGCGHRSFRQKCRHLAKKQRAKFYILRRCIAMLVCWHERHEPKE